MYGDELITDNIKLAYKLAWQLKDTYPRIELDEIQSICLLGLTEAAKKYDRDKSAFSTYAWQVMKNAVYTYNQKNFKYNETSLNSIIEEGIELQDIIKDDTDPYESVEKNIEYEQLYKNIDKLSIAHRTMIKLTLDGYTKSKIARLFNMTESMITSEYNKAINQLRDMYKENANE